MAKATKKAAKKRGRKPGVKVGPYKKANKTPILDDGLDLMVLNLQIAIRERIKTLTAMLKRIK